MKSAPNPSHVPKKTPFLHRSENGVLLRRIFFNHNSNNYKWKIRMVSPISRLGQIVSLPNPSTEMGFQLKPSLALRALLQNSIFFKWIVNDPFPTLIHHFYSSTFLFLHWYIHLINIWREIPSKRGLILINSLFLSFHFIIRKWLYQYHFPNSSI